MLSVLRRSRRNSFIAVDLSESNESDRAENAGDSGGPGGRPRPGEAALSRFFASADKNGEAS
jgi:hypothetical protein